MVIFIKIIYSKKVIGNYIKKNYVLSTVIYNKNSLRVYRFIHVIINTAKILFGELLDNNFKRFVDCAL